MKETIKKILPEPIQAAARYTMDSLRRLKDLPDAYLHPWRKETRQKIQKFHNKHQGERCFIMGNGPSLKNTDLSLLKNEITFGMNRIYLAFEEIGFPTTYFVSVNDLVIEQCAHDILALDIPRFVSWRGGKQWLKPDDDLYFLYSTYSGPKFATDIRNRLWESATVTFVSLQLAYYMGFDEVILIGVDHNFATKGKPNTTIVSEGDDPNHFDPRYFGKGFRWQLPDLDTSEVGYAMARAAFEADNRKVYDATVGGKLQIFEKKNYLDLFK